MAKNYQGILGNFSGKVGNIVGRVRSDRTVIAVYQPEVGNPQTTSQMTQRQKLAKVTEFLKGAANIVRFSMKSLTKYGTGWSAAIQYNMTYAVTGTYPNQQVDQSLARISAGNIDLPYSPNASADGTTLSLTWADNSGMGNALATDVICAACYNKTKGQWVSNTEVGERNERNGSFALPTTWAGNDVDVFMYVRRGNTEFSNSSYLAQLPL